MLFFVQDQGLISSNPFKRAAFTLKYSLSMASPVGFPISSRFVCRIPCPVYQDSFPHKDGSLQSI